MKTKKLLSVLLFLSLLISTLSLPVFASDIIKEPRKTALSASSIFTEEYCVEYTENPDGSLTLDSSSFNDLISLSYDNSALEKIVFDKETSTKKEKFNQDSFSVESSPAIADSEWKTYLRELKKQKSNNEVFTVSDQNTVSVIKSISNFYSDIVLLSQTPTAQGVELDVAYL